MGFKPYYKWITFNTSRLCVVISITNLLEGFKPYYKWITFNTKFSPTKREYFLMF